MFNEEYTEHNTEAITYNFMPAAAAAGAVRLLYNLYLLTNVFAS